MFEIRHVTSRQTLAAEVPPDASGEEERVMPNHPARRQRRVEDGSTMRINVRIAMETPSALVAASVLAGLSLPRPLIESALHGPLEDGVFEIRDGGSNTSTSPRTD